MKYIDILKNLNIKLTDDKKFQMLKVKILDEFNYINDREKYNDEYSCPKFFHDIGVSNDGNYIIDIGDFISNETDFLTYLSYINLFIQILYEENQKYALTVLDRFKNKFDECNISYIIDKNNFLILPNEASELNENMIDGLCMLSNYPEVRKYGINCIAKYKTINENNINDFLDSLRKLLEIFFQKFFQNNKSLDDNNKKLKQYLMNNNISKILTTFNHTMIDLYDKYNNKEVKHNIKGDLIAAEYIMYETFNVIRFVLQISINSQNDTLN